MDLVLHSSLFFLLRSVFELVHTRAFTTYYCLAVRKGKRSNVSVIFHYHGILLDLLHVHSLHRSLAGAFFIDLCSTFNRTKSPIHLVLGALSNGTAIFVFENGPFCSRRVG